MNKVNKSLVKKINKGDRRPKLVTLDMKREILQQIPVKFRRL